MYRVVNKKRKKRWVKEKVSRKWKNWYQNEVGEKTKGAESRDKVKHNGRSDQLFLEDDEGARTKVTTDEERVLRGRTLNGDEVMKVYGGWVFVRTL